MFLGFLQRIIVWAVDAGDVHECVDVAEFLDGVSHHGISAVGLADIDGAMLRAQFCSNPGDLSILDVG